MGDKFVKKMIILAIVYLAISILGLVQMYL